MSGALRLSPAVREILRVATVEGNRLQLVGQLDRKTYLEVAKAIETMGGKWSKKERCHLFEDPAGAVVQDAIATGTVLDLKKAFQFFETPPEVAAHLVELAEVAPWHRILEPSAGRGRIIEAVKTAGGVLLFACELDSRHYQALGDLGADLVGFDFLDLQGEPRFDRIIANPPFTRQQDIKHVLHMWELLAAGGRLVSVMSPGWTYRSDRLSESFKRLVIEQQGAWTELPEDSFKASGTSVNTGVIVLNKPIP